MNRIVFRLLRKALDNDYVVNEIPCVHYGYGYILNWNLIHVHLFYQPFKVIHSNSNSFGSLNCFSWVVLWQCNDCLMWFIFLIHVFELNMSCTFYKVCQTNFLLCCDGLFVIWELNMISIHRKKWNHRLNIITKYLGRSYTWLISIMPKNLAQCKNQQFVCLACQYFGRDRLP